MLYYNNSCSREVGVVPVFHCVTASARCAFLLLILVLGLNAVSLYHEADTSEDFHATHHCTVFDSIHHAVIYASTSIPPTIVLEVLDTPEHGTAFLSESCTPRMRSPPFS
nr:DUF2607 family protein [Enterovibrio baiacu]